MQCKAHFYYGEHSIIDIRLGLTLPGEACMIAMSFTECPSTYNASMTRFDHVG